MAKQQFLNQLLCSTFVPPLHLKPVKPEYNLDVGANPSINPDMSIRELYNFMGAHLPQITLWKFTYNEQTRAKPGAALEPPAWLIDYVRVCLPKCRHQAIQKHIEQKRNAWNAFLNTKPFQHARSWSAKFLRKISKNLHKGKHFATYRHICTTFIMFSMQLE